jgi:hypothetical protein
MKTLSYYAMSILLLHNSLRLSVKLQVLIIIIVLLFSDHNNKTNLAFGLVNFPQDLILSQNEYDNLIRVRIIY